MPREETNASTPRVSVDSLDTNHRQVFSRALQNVLSSDAAELTYAQIVDGLPLSAIERDTIRGSVDCDHPIHTKHTELCPGVIERLREIIDTHDIGSLKFDSTLVDAYNNASPGSRAFETRLIEMTAVAVHQIAVQLFKSETSLHESDGMGSWQPAEDSVFWDIHKTMFPTLFRHPQYCDYGLYPDGLADGVAYWAENRILGGVVLFDRRAPDSPPNTNNEIEVDPNAIYFHSSGRMITYRIYQLIDKQRCDLVKFLLSETTPPAECPIPIHGTSENQQRIDPEEAVTDTGVYRDVWERKPLALGQADPRDRTVWDKIEHPTLREFCNTRRRAGLRKMRAAAIYREEERKKRHKIHKPHKL
ncbi:hypothetical protein F4824DRAFT_496144 [Ustulina deusta]|nr:hypothetical protein F4824DRAFT_496144 [Ustulina deusta]